MRPVPAPTWISLLLMHVLLTVSPSSASVAAHAGEWSPPITLVETHGRLAIGNQLHVVGHSWANLVHRRSNDGGTTWTTATTVAAAATNYPMQYGGLFAVADTLYLLTAAGDMGPSARHLDFRRSADNGLTWTARVAEARRFESW